MTSYVSSKVWLVKSKTSLGRKWFFFKIKCFKVRSFKVECFKVKCFEVKSFEIKCFEVKRPKVKCFEVKGFEIKCFKVKSFRVKCFKLKSFKLKCLLERLRGRSLHRGTGLSTCCSTRPNVYCWKETLEAP